MPTSPFGEVAIFTSGDHRNSSEMFCHQRSRSHHNSSEIRLNLRVPSSLQKDRTIKAPRAARLVTMARPNVMSQTSGLRGPGKGFWGGGVSGAAYRAGSRLTRFRGVISLRSTVSESSSYGERLTRGVVGPMRGKSSPFPRTDYVHDIQLLIGLVLSSSKQHPRERSPPLVNLRVRPFKFLLRDMTRSPLKH